MLEMAFSDSDSIGKGRSFNCDTCLDSIKKKRRCTEDRWDFTHRDDIIFPMPIQKGGTKYGFCPGKITQAGEMDAKRIFDVLILSSETNQLLYSGGLMEQPAWFIEQLTWLMPRHKQYKNYQEQKAMWGSGGSNNRNAKR